SMRVTDIRPAEDADRLIAAATEIPQAWTHSGTRRHLLKSGQIIDVEVTSHGLRFHDKAARLVAASDVTERRRAEETRRLLATIVESSDDAIVGKALDGTILSWNRGAERLYGFSPAEAIGQPISIIIPSSIQGEAPELLTRLGRAEHVTHHETVRRRKDGSLVPISLTLSPIVDAAGHVVAGSAIGRDISERTRAEQALKESEARFRRIAETVTEVFWIAEVGLETMIYVNPAYERIWGRTCESLYRDPRSFLDTIHQDDRARVLADLEVQMAGLPFDHEYRICRPNGDVRWIWNRGFPVRDANESVFQYVGVAQDITERRILEEQFRQ
ncbi:MAG TPA: PAS domain S-box protein, partial [Vicinamibacterales bacterium]|nr:PAS domain S-box protein [Vicinamibacterales bacterium]